MIRKTLFLFLLFLGFGLSAAAEDSERVNHQAVRVVKEFTPHWIGTWATAMQTPVKTFMPYNNQMSNRSVRQIVKVSAGGDVVRLQLSNIFSTTPVVLRSVYIAPACDGPGRQEFVLRCRTLCVEALAARCHHRQLSDSAQGADRAHGFPYHLLYIKRREQALDRLLPCLPLREVVQHCCPRCLHTRRAHYRHPWQ